MKKITEEELKTILEQLKLWFDSNGKEGERANLYEDNLTGAILIGADLTGSSLTGASLTMADLELAILTDTILDEKEQCRKGVVFTKKQNYEKQ